MIDIPNWYNPQGSLTYGLTTTFVAPAVQPREYQTAFVLGRFQPLHIGHIGLISGALRIAETVLVVIGSSFEAVTSKNPFSFFERREMIRDYFRPEIAEGRLIIDGISDYTYRDEKFYDELASIVKDRIGNTDPVFYTYGKDKATSEYIDGMGGRFRKVFHNPVNNTIDATDIRDMYFTYPTLQIHNLDRLTEKVVEIMETFRETDAYKSLHKQHVAERNYRLQWANVPFPVQFMATDALVEWAPTGQPEKKHILVIKRKSEFGNGKLALPGGYLDSNETFLQGAIRELKEETGLAVDDSFILRKVTLFDDPNRSRRGRMITNVHHWQIVGHSEPPKLQAGDDAGEAFWLPVDRVYYNKIQFFSDHYPIIAKMIPEVESD